MNDLLSCSLIDLHLAHLLSFTYLLQIHSENFGDVWDFEKKTWSRLTHLVSGSSNSPECNYQKSPFGV